MVGRRRRGHGVGQSVVVQSCGVQLGRFHGEAPTAIGDPAAGVRGSRADGPQEVWHTSSGSSRGIYGTIQREELSDLRVSEKKRTASSENKDPEMMWDQTVNSVSFKPRYFQLNSSVSIKELQVKFHSTNQVPV